MKAIYGLYNTPRAAQRAFDGLRSEGVPTGGIVVMSSEPFEEWEFGNQDNKTAMPWIAVAGATLGFLGAYLLTVLTQRAWPINTGGMPIVTNWTNIIILFEMTMLGAVLATVLTLLGTARLPAKLPEFYDPAISTGSILVGVANPEGTKLPGIERALGAAQAEKVRKVA
jgi:Alternative complex III, ActD subunit